MFHSTNQLDNTLSKKDRFVNMAKFLSKDKTCNMLFFNKTKKCNNLNCPFENRCTFAHSDDELIDKKTLPCLYGPYCILLDCEKLHLDLDSSIKFHELIYKKIIEYKKNVKKPSNLNQNSNCNSICNSNCN